MARTGRRPGRTDTRAAILAAARRSFTERGYDGTTIRAVAADAGVDPKLVSHFFGRKDALFAAALDLPRAPTDVLSSALEGPEGRLGERIVATFLSIWDSPGGSALIALLRSVGSNERSATMLSELAQSEMLPRIAGRLRGPSADLRAALMGAHLMGMAMARYVLRVEPLASAPPARVVTAMGPVLQRYVEFYE